MTKKNNYLVLAITSLLFIFNVTSIAQDEAHIYLIQTFKTVMPEGGSEAERDSLIGVWIDASLKKNDKILSQKVMSHYYGNDSRDWVVITEYKNWGDIEASDEVNIELNRKRWPDAKERREFFQKIFKYFDGHSDEIYLENSKLSK